MFILSINAAKKRTAVKILLVISALLITAVLAFVLSAVCEGEDASDGFETRLDKLGGISGFLAQFSLEQQRQESIREITLPQADDSVFAEYGDFQSQLGFKVLEFAGKRVEERYLRLKNKTEKGKVLYAVLYTYKERVIAAHITTLEQGAEMQAITEFG